MPDALSESLRIVRPVAPCLISVRDSNEIVLELYIRIDLATTKFARNFHSRHT